MGMQECLIPNCGNETNSCRNVAMMEMKGLAVPKMYHINGGDPLR
jgi:hypothetical protein